MNTMEWHTLQLYMAVYAMICLIYSTYYYRISREDAFIRFVITICVPIVGYVLFLVIDKSIERVDEKLDLDSMQSSMCDNNHYYPLNQKDIVPVEEALLVNDNLVKRGLIIDVVKDQDIHQVNLLQQALKDSDTETSHYAASAIMQMKSDYDMRLKELASIHEEQPHSSQELMDYIDTLYEYLDSGLMESIRQRKGMHTCSMLLKQLQQSGIPKKKYYMMIITLDMAFGHMEEALINCQSFEKQYRLEEEPYLLYMKIYYKMKDANGLRDTLNQFRNLPINISADALKILRFWEVHHEGV